MAIDTFVRSIAINKGTPYCFLLGAGASISSGMPSAERCVWEWKREIFVTNNPSLSESVGELSLPGTRTRIQDWLDMRGDYPPINSDNEYSYYAQACYPTHQDRRQFFASFVRQAKPHIGYQLFPLLVKGGLIRSVWTTNFDGLVARSCAASDVVTVEVGVDCSQRAIQPYVQGELRTVSLHGDFRYDELKNTEDELKKQESNLEQALERELENCSLIVAGYSGRDESLMAVLRHAFTNNKSSSRIYWCGYGESPSEKVVSFLQEIKASGREALYVNTDGFDDMISRLSLRYLEGDLLNNAKALLQVLGSEQTVTKPFVVPASPPSSLFKSNAYPVSLPLSALKINLKYPDGAKPRDWLNEKLDPINVSGVVFGNDGALVLGNAEEIIDALGSAVKGKIKSVELSIYELSRDGRIRSLMQRALVCAVAKQLGFSSNLTNRLWEPLPYDRKLYQGKRFQIHKAVSIKLINLQGKIVSVLTPEVIITNNEGSIADFESSKVIKNEVYGYQHNKEFDDDLRHFTDKLTNIDIQAWSHGVFRITKASWYAGLIEKNKPPLTLEYRRVAKQHGFILPDVPLVFASKDGGSECRDANPLKGLLYNRPWDYSLTTEGLSPNVEVSVLCPRQDTQRFSSFLSSLHARFKPSRTEQDYLLEYPGFANAFGTPLSIPSHSDPTWMNLDDSSLPSNSLEAAKTLGRRICNELNVIRSLNPGSVVVIFVPSRWRELNIVRTDIEHFNLHDYIKAFAARMGLSTQFIREETMAGGQKCRIYWWLSLALYVKALRSPWRLDCIDDQTAYVGIGYSIDQEASIGNHVLLGCSHLYSARGEGLQFRLGRIENPIYRGKNPFMSEDDARRTGETIRQLFFDAKMRLPDRVVIHKKTYFTQEEKRGLTQGLEGISNIELIEINIEPSLKYLSSKLISGRLGIDSFPVPRGTSIVLDKHSALLWVHGAAPNVLNPNWKYYQGKRRIPSPLLIRRHLGQSDLEQVASEILGLSKMDWNNFDYYSQLPVTLTSASAIARVGTYLSGFGAAPYDYRLLI
ncbi:nuclease PIN [Mariprofundus ferrooxydans]|uniref:SIR2 family protein n=1 Tax=Mariprofundus ferrooxydans TaxID=314344 RepID=UPI0005924765|nr:SIR2 family protein [Mariprofundus ferrooxydans]KON46555.1 nuclease PIN [Mariprofundus ferrooxydans]